MPHVVYTKAQYLRKMGNIAVHSRKNIPARSALGAAMELRHVLYWLTRAYTQGDPAAIPEHFDESLLPPPATDVVQQSTTQLQKQNEALKARDEALLKQQRENEALRAQLAALQAQIAAQRAVNEVIPDTHDYSEAETRRLAQNNPQLVSLATSLADTLHGYVAAMNTDNFIVRPLREQVDPFQARQRWDSLSRANAAQLAQYVSGLPSTQSDDDETAKRFDLMVLDLQLAHLEGAARFNTLRDKIIDLAANLETKTAIPRVKAQLNWIQDLQTEPFWTSITLPLMEDIRLLFNQHTLTFFGVILRPRPEIFHCNPDKSHG